MANKYQVYGARDDHGNLAEVLEYVATVKGHVRIVNVMWQPARLEIDSGYTIIAEVAD
jgi:hydroxypyruvate isomerase